MYLSVPNDTFFIRSSPNEVYYTVLPPDIRPSFLVLERIGIIKVLPFTKFPKVVSEYSKLEEVPPPEQWYKQIVLAYSKLEIIQQHPSRITVLQVSVHLTSENLSL